MVFVYQNKIVILGAKVKSLFIYLWFSLECCFIVVVLASQRSKCIHIFFCIYNFYTIISNHKVIQNHILFVHVYLQGMIFVITSFKTYNIVGTFFFAYVTSLNVSFTFMWKANALVKSFQLRVNTLCDKDILLYWSLLIKLQGLNFAEKKTRFFYSCYYRRKHFRGWKSSHWV